MRGNSVIGNSIVGDTVQVKAGLWDRLGIGLSVMCLVHCLALPLMATGLSLWASHEQVHFWLAVGLVPVIILAAIPGYRAHRRRRVLWLFALGVLGVTGALAVEPWIGVGGETVVTVVGSGFLIAGHWVNWRLRDHVHSEPEALA